MKNMSLNKRLVEEINQGSDQTINELAIWVMELVEKYPQDFTKNEEKILEEIREIVWEESDGTH